MCGGRGGKRAGGWADARAGARAEERAGRRGRTKARGGEGEVGEQGDGGTVVSGFGFRVSGSGLRMRVRA